MASADSTATQSGWSQLYRIAAAFAIVVTALIPIQSFIFVAFPPPSDVIDFFNLFQHHKLLGLLDLDLLLTLDNLLVAVVYLGLYVALRETNKSLITIALVLGLIGTVLYLVSREATFSMLSLSNQYAAASDTQRAPLLAAGQTLLTIYNGSAFDVSYILGAITVLLVSSVALRSKAFGKPVGWVGIITGILMLLPPTIGTVGLYVSMISLLPTMAWLILLTVRFLRLARTPS